MKRWYFRATPGRLQPMIYVARSIRRHWDGVLRWFDSGITNGVLEAVNNLVQSAEAQTRGCGSTGDDITVMYLIAGKLDLSFIHVP